MSLDAPVAGGIEGAAANIDKAAEAHLQHLLPDLDHEARCEEILRRRLKDSRVILEADESIDLLVYLLGKGEERAELLKFKDMVVLIGHTGAGKSTLANYLAGCSFRAVEGDAGDEVFIVVPKSKGGNLDEMTKIGHMDSETFLPEIVSGPGNLIVCDCPGFLDLRGPEISIANAVNIKMSMASAASVRVIAMIDLDSLKAMRGKGVSDLVKICSHLFGSEANIIQHQDSTCICISKVPVDRPAHKVQELLAKRLNSESKIGVLAERPLLFDPMDRAECQGRKGRQECLEMLEGMSGIQEPTKVFQTVLSLWFAQCGCKNHWWRTD
mmetsp:Transcript_30589/g.76997  ORF Transcript_30589/g.76997 Transcript_30589/m.76997 type:complete len:326 (-) Transcript_30589:1223-2200(-)